MAFPVVTKQDVRAALELAGVRPGQCVYVASYMPILGAGPDLVRDVLDAVVESVGAQGTVIMPAFNWAFCRGEVFDHANTPAQTGVLCEAFRRRPGVLRNLEPPWCTYCFLGREAERLAGVGSQTPFGPGSIAQVMVDENVRYVLIGCSYNEAVIHVHWLEEKYQVPYRFWKPMPGVALFEGRALDLTPKMYARRLDVDTRIDSSHLTAGFEKSGKVAVAPLGLGHLRSFMTADYVAHMTPFFEQDRLAVLVPSSRPLFQGRPG